MITRSQLKWIFISLVALRLIIGFHFFTEGKKKLDQGDWSAAPFFAAAHGPLAPYFFQLLPDADRTETLCVVEVPASIVEEETGTEFRQVAANTYAKIDIAPTLGYWSRFLQDVLVGYRLSQDQIKQRVENLTNQIEELDKSITQLKTTSPESVGDLEGKRNELVALVRRLQEADPLNDALEIVERRQNQLESYLNDPVIQSEILKAVSDENRLSGFTRDGVNREKVATYVDSLRGQVDTIRGDIKKVKTQHATVVEGIWNGLESELNAYGASLQSPVESGVTLETKVEMQKPFAVQRWSPLFWINLVIPYFDFTVGILLLVGLFSRLASLAAAGFLLGIIITQPIWVPGYDPRIIYQIVEFGGLLVLAATVAGRYGGLDYFLWLLFRRPAEPTDEGQESA